MPSPFVIIITIILIQVVQKPDFFVVRFDMKATLLSRQLNILFSVVSMCYLSIDIYSL